MRNVLILLFSAILVTMLAVTLLASQDRNVLLAAVDLWADPWGRATILDACFGFLTVYVWVAWRERSWLWRVVWFVLFMGLGNIAIAIYMLRALIALPPGASVAELLRRPEAP